MRLTRQEIETQNAKRAFSGKLDEQFYRQMRNELLDYKFIEEELGIDLITLFKAIMSKNGFKWENKYGFIITLDREEMQEIKNVLTKEELEK